MWGPVAHSERTECAEQWVALSTGGDPALVENTEKSMHNDSLDTLMYARFDLSEPRVL